MRVLRYKYFLLVVTGLCGCPSQQPRLLCLLSTLLFPTGMKKKDRFWIPLSEQVVTLIYRLGDQPDSLCGDVIHRMAASLLQETQTVTDSQEGGEFCVKRAVTFTEPLLLWHNPACRN